MSPHIKDLPVAVPTTPDEIAFVAQTEKIGTAKVTMKSLIDQVKESLGYYPEVLKKCKYCGQWGAVMCACPACGAPIDP